mgnify:CR=1 FL=1
MGDLDGSCQDPLASAKSQFSKEGVATFPPPDVWAAGDFANIPCKRKYNSWSVAVMLLSFLDIHLLHSALSFSELSLPPSALKAHKVKTLATCRKCLDKMLLMSPSDKKTLQGLYSSTANDRPSLKVLLDIFTRYRDTLLDYVIDNSLL